MRNRGKIVIVCSNKGGVGKTFITRAIADYFDQVGQTWVGFDADHSSGKFRQFYREHVSTVDLRREETLGQVITAAQRESGAALLDVPAAHGAELTGWLNASGLVGRKAAAEVVLCLVITAERDTVEFADDAWQELGGKVTWLVVKNALYGRRCDSYDASQVRRRLCKSGAIEVEIPRLFQTTEEELKAKTLPVGAALRGRELNLTPRHRLFAWRRQTFAAFSSAKEVLCTNPT